MKKLFKNVTNFVTSTTKKVASKVKGFFGKFKKQPEDEKTESN